MPEENVALVPRAGRLLPPRRVLVAFDGSPGAWAALRYGIDAAITGHAVLMVAAVVNDPPRWVALSPFAVPWTRESLRRDSERRLLRALAAARDEVPASISVSTVLLRGRTAAALAALAEGGRYDLVIAGHRDGRRMGRWLRSGVTAGVLARCRTSVLMIRLRTTD